MCFAFFPNNLIGPENAVIFTRQTTNKHHDVQASGFAPITDDKRSDSHTFCAKSIGKSSADWMQRKKPTFGSNDLVKLLKNPMSKC